MRISRSAALLATPVAASLALSACSFSGGSGEQSEDGSNGGGDLTISLQFAPRANFALETDDAFVLTQVGCLETLVKYNVESGELEPLLATEWTQTEPTAWDFTLQEGVTFQDGTELTADVVVDALTAALEVDAPARAFGPETVSSVEAVDEGTVRITTPSPSPLVPYRLASVNTGILAPGAYTESGTDPVGNCTGPFEPISVEANQSMQLERYDDYWGGDVTLASVKALFIPEGATRATQVQTGEAHIALGIPSTSVPDLESNSDVEVTRAFTPRTSGLYFNTSKAPFDDPDVRRAVQMALDLQSISDNVFDGSVEPAIGPFSPEEPWASDTEPVSQDTEAAAALLTEAGYAPGEINVELLGYTERAEFADLATVIQASLQEIGIGVSVQISDYAAIEPSLLEGSYDMALLSRNHLTDIADPIGFFEADYTCDGGYNISHYCNPEVDELIASAESMDDAEERYAVYAEVAGLLQDEAVTGFLVHEQTTAAARNGVENFVDDPLARYAVTPELSLGDGGA